MDQIYSISDIYRDKLVHVHLSVTVIAVALSGTNMYLAVWTLEIILLWPLLTQTLTDAKRWCQISKICRAHVKAKHAGTHSYWEHQQSNCIKESRRQKKNKKNTHTLKFSQWNQTKCRFKGDKVQMYIHVHVYWNIGGNWIWQLGPNPSLQQYWWIWFGGSVWNCHHKNMRVRKLMVVAKIDSQTAIFF